MTWMPRAGPSVMRFNNVAAGVSASPLLLEKLNSSSCRSGDAPTPAATLLSLITEGPARGIHVIVTCDTYNNVTRQLGRKALAEFEMRVLFQMSAADSASLIDAPNAATLGLNRAVLFNEREASLETFRPYSPPGADWLEDAAKMLAAK